jgi:hypothetical protein
MIYLFYIKSLKYVWIYLEDWKWKVMNEVVQGRKPFTDRMKYAFYINIEKLKKMDLKDKLI